MRRKLTITLAVLLLCTSLLAPLAAAVDVEPFIDESRDLATDNEWEALVQINHLRLAEGMPPLAMAEALQPLAAWRAFELSYVFGSTRPDGEAPWYTVLDEAEIAYTAAAELIARGFPSGATVVAEWANEEMDIILGDYTHIAISHNIDQDIWCVLFIYSGEHESLRLHFSGTRYLTAGQSLESLRLMLETYGAIGPSFIPLVDSMVRDFDTNRASVQQPKFELFGFSGSFRLEVRFTDVDYNDWYANYVRFATENGLFNGVSPTEFAPHASMTRAMFVTVLGRQAERMGLPITGDHSQFTDVRDGAWYSRYIAWAVERGITHGIGGGLFGVHDTVTREQMATFLLRFVDYAGIELTPDGVVPLDFDLPYIADLGAVSSWARNAVVLLVVLNFIDLDAFDQFRPAEDATRAVVAKALTVLARDHV